MSIEQRLKLVIIIVSSSTIDKILENILKIDKKSIIDSKFSRFIFVNFEFIFDIFVNFEFYFEIFVNFEFFLSTVDEVNLRLHCLTSSCEKSEDRDKLKHDFLSMINAKLCQ